MIWITQLEIRFHYFLFEFTRIGEQLVRNACEWLDFTTSLNYGLCSFLQPILQGCKKQEVYFSKIWWGYAHGVVFQQRNGLLFGPSTNLKDSIMYGTSQFRRGLKIELDGTPYQITEFQHVKPGKGNAFVRTKLKNLITGLNLEKTFKSGEKVQRPDLEDRKMEFLLLMVQVLISMYMSKMRVWTSQAILMFWLARMELISSMSMLLWALHLI